MGKKSKKDAAVATTEKLGNKEYENELQKLHVELVKLQEWVVHKGLKVCVVFEGRDGAGKGGVIKAITERVSPRVFRVVALPAPTEREKSQLYAQRIKLAKPDDYVVLPEVISKEPLGPAVRQGDEEWFDVARWTLFAMLNAEEMGITSKNVEEVAKTTKNPDVARLLGSEGDYGKDLKLPKDWAVQVIKQVGNYGEVFDRNVGAGSDLKIERGLNALWNKGGVQYAPPVR
ncbi:polyphosphate kinase 2 [compost metagenome]